MCESRRRTRLSMLALVAAVVLGPDLTAQTLQIGAGGGIRFPLGDAGGDTKEFYAGTKYGLSTGYNFQAKGRLGLAGVSLFAEIDYGRVSNSGESEPGQGKVEVSQSLVAIKAGPELHFKLPFVSPYVGANLAFNSVSGEVKFNGVARVASGTYDVEAASRIGFGLMAGGVLSLGPMLSLDVNLEYAWLNPFSTVWEDPNPTKDQRLDSYLALNDDKDPLAGAGADPNIHVVRQSRSINSFAVTVSLMFGL